MGLTSNKIKHHGHHDGFQASGREEFASFELLVTITFQDEVGAQRLVHLHADPIASAHPEGPLRGSGSYATRWSLRQQLLWPSCICTFSTLLFAITSLPDGFLTPKAPWTIFRRLRCRVHPDEPRMELPTLSDSHLCFARPMTVCQEPDAAKLLNVIAE